MVTSSTGWSALSSVAGVKLICLGSIPNGESAADAYDRISGFNESLWRQFGDDEFPSVCVLVTHGLMSRVFLMKCSNHDDIKRNCKFIQGKFARMSLVRSNIILSSIL